MVLEISKYCKLCGKICTNVSQVHTPNSGGLIRSSCVNDVRPWIKNKFYLLKISKWNKCPNKVGKGSRRRRNCVLYCNPSRTPHKIPQIPLPVGIWAHLIPYKVPQVDMSLPSKRHIDGSCFLANSLN